MTRIITLFALVLLLFFALLMRAADRPQSTRDAEHLLMQLEQDWSAAYLSHDVSTINRILADDYIGIDGRAFVSNKAQELEEAKAPLPGDAHPAFEILGETIGDMRVRRYGDAAIVTGRSVEKVRLSGKGVEMQYRRTTVWIKRAGRWQCVSFHASRIMD